MTCAAGGSITFMPNIKNWWQAVSLASANYIGEIFQGMMIGVTVGAAGMTYLGGAAAYSVGGMRAVGQAGLKFLASTPRNLAVNAIESVSKVGLLFRGVGGTQGALQSYGETGNASAGSIAEGVFGGEISAYRVVTGQGSWNDVWGTAMMFLPVGQGKRDVENSFRSAADDAADGPVRDTETTRADEGETTRTDEPETTKSDDPENTKADEEEGTTNKNTESESPTKPDKDGQAYEDVPKPKSNPKLIEEVSKKAEEMINNAREKVDGYSNKKNGPCLSGVYDSVTGKTSFGTNFRKNVAGNAEYTKFVEDAHPIVKERIEAQQRLIDEGKMPPETDLRAGGHSEVRALDQAIKAREAQTGKPVTEADLGSFDLHNRHMPNNNPMHRCGNCSNITNGVNTVGGHN